MSRRVAKATAMGTNKFVYDGWLPVREQSASGGNATSNYYVWGLDLSQSMQGAGGIGGLLATVIDGEPYFPAYDANGNITQYTDTNGTVVTHYEYDPFGNISAQSGAMAADFSYRFSTKYTDDETGLVYYGFRYYSPMLGRWMSRDPLAELSFREHSMPETFRIQAAAFDAEIMAFISVLAVQKPGLANYLRKRLIRHEGALINATLQYSFLRNSPVDVIDSLGLDAYLGHYGNYCGPGWCAGKQQKEKDCVCNGSSAPPPANAIDACCKTHDKCLGTGGSHECDDAMCQCLEKVDPVNEPVPPDSSLDNQIKSYNKMRGLFCGMSIPGH